MNFYKLFIKKHFNVNEVTSRRYRDIKQSPRRNIGVTTEITAHLENFMLFLFLLLVQWVSLLFTSDQLLHCHYPSCLLFLNQIPAIIVPT